MNKNSLLCFQQFMYMWYTLIVDTTCEDGHDISTLKLENVMYLVICIVYKVFNIMMYLYLYTGSRRLDKTES